jgi:hypothetical protein
MPEESTGEYIAKPAAMHNSAKVICRAMATDMPAITELHDMVGRFGDVIDTTSGTATTEEGDMGTPGGERLGGGCRIGGLAPMVFSNAYFPALFLPPSAFKELSASRNLMV